MKMSAIQERRARGLAVQPGKPSLLPVVAGAIAAFVGGAILVMATGAIKLPAFPTALRAQAVPAGKAGPVTTFATDRPRLGHAASAPLLRQCLPHAMLGLDDDSRLPIGDAYALLKSGSRATGLAAAGLKKDATGDSAAVFSAAWGEVADCVYRQNGWALCDADNRALAVESVNAFVKQAAIARTSTPDIFEEVKAEPRRRGGPTYSAQPMQAVQERVLAALRARVEQGYLIAVDFGMFAPGAVNTVLTRAQTQKNSCAERR